MPTQRDRLQPTLFDRLSDDSPLNPHDTDDRRVFSRAALRESVVQSLTSLFNAIQPDLRKLEQYPRVQRSVVGYGLPALAGKLASKIDAPLIESLMLEAIRRYEPRIVGQTLSVQAVKSRLALSMQNVIEFEIHGELRAQPVPIEILLRTQVDLEGGHINVTELG